MAAAEAPAAEGAQQTTAAPAATPSPPERPSPSSATPQGGEPQAAVSPPQETETQAPEADPYGQVAELDFDEIVKRHPRAGKRLEALATKKAQTLQQERDEQTRKQTEQEQRQRARDLWKTWKTDPDDDARNDAGAKLIDLLGAPIDQEVSEEAYADKVEAARTETRQRIWEQHAQSFGLDPQDEDVAEVLSEAKDFKALNAALIGLAKDAEAVERMWLHPEIQKRHTAALEEAAETARAAATINGQASVIGGRRLDVSASGGGRPQTPDEVIAEVAEITQRGQKPSRELWDAYRRATGRIGPTQTGAAPASAN